MIRALVLFALLASPAAAQDLARAGHCRLIATSGPPDGAGRRLVTVTMDPACPLGAVESVRFASDTGGVIPAFGEFQLNTVYPRELSRTLGPAWYALRCIPKSAFDLFNPLKCFRLIETPAVVGS